MMLSYLLGFGTAGFVGLVGYGIAYDRGWWTCREPTEPEANTGPLTLPARPDYHAIPPRIVGPVSARPTRDEVLAAIQSACRLYQMREDNEPCPGCEARTDAVMALLAPATVPPEVFDRPAPWEDMS